MHFLSLPALSVIVTMVLLYVAFTWAMGRSSYGVSVGSSLRSRSLGSRSRAESELDCVGFNQSRSKTRLGERTLVRATNLRPLSI